MRIVQLNELAKVQARVLVRNRNLSKLEALEEEVKKAFPEIEG